MKRADEKPSLSGHWEVELERSTQRGPETRRITIDLDHREESLIQDVRAEEANGEEERAIFSYRIDGETENLIGGSSAVSRANWEGPELVIENRRTRAGSEFRFKDHWSLSEDGRTLTMTHRDGALAGQTTVLKRIS